MFVNDRQSARNVFAEVWRKHKSSLPLQPLEALILDVIQEHPEFHARLENREELQETEYGIEDGETNPFLHMGLHIALREQLQANRPAGVVAVYRRMLHKKLHRHEIEHKIMSVLAECLWNARQAGTLPDEQAYLEQLEKLE